MRILKKILIVSSDSDFLHIHNRIVKFDIEAEVYSPQHYQSNKYTDHNQLFEYESSITNNQNTSSSSHIYFEEEEHKNHNEDTDYYTEEDTDEDDSIDHATYHNMEDDIVDQEIEEEEDDCFDEKNVEDCMKNVLLCFRWINKKKKPYKAVSVVDFSNTYIELMKVGLLYPVMSFSKMYDYLFYTNKMSVEDNDVENIKIKPKFFDDCSTSMVSLT